jgi:hypothetical protein
MCQKVVHLFLHRRRKYASGHQKQNRVSKTSDAHHKHRSRARRPRAGHSRPSCACLAKAAKPFQLQCKVQLTAAVAREQKSVRTSADVVRCQAPTRSSVYKELSETASALTW